MVRKKGSFILCGAFLFVAWNALLLLYLWGRPPIGKVVGGGNLAGEVMRLAEEVEVQLEKQKELLKQIESHRAQWARQKDNKLELTSSSSPQVVIPVLVIACDRVTVKRSLDRLIQYRLSAPLHPIIVSQDCGHADTARVIRSYGEQLTHISQPDLSDIRVRPEHRKFQGYYKIDDLEVAPDFFEYFRALYPILRDDSSLWCVSAWNDNGRDALVDPAKAHVLHRTDFFPGLGWMLTRDLWAELEPKWPTAFWDDWMRQPEQRRERSCVRPEISRTITFGRKGVSLGQFFDQYLRYIKLNTEFVPFTKQDLTYLLREKYDEKFIIEVYSAPLVRIEELQGGKLREPGPYRVQYSSRDSFKVFARNLGAMDDLKSGVPRTGYRGVVSFLYRGRRVYLAPPEGWTQYDTSWS
uniref:Alpha-1,3-mannosyl-glycoprotein 2-beta-N-acetylglucosaminyltransferase n=1 Tax=Neogobius melanostomus TaxID=47308 RepID=A0A8C6UAM5_9GOBI